MSMISWTGLTIALLLLFLFHRFFNITVGQARVPQRQSHQVGGTPITPDKPMAFQKLGLLDLPDEILVAIVSNIDIDGLFDVRLTSRHLKELAEPLFFERFNVLRGSDARRLAKYINADPRRAKCLKSLLVSTRHGDDNGLDLLPRYLSEMRNIQDLRLETPDCNTKTPIERISWVQLQQGYEDILAQSTVAVEPDKRLLSKLQSCTIHFVDETKALYPLTKYSSIFLHPTLKSLTLSCACTDFPRDLLAPYQDRYRRSTNLENLHLEECDIYSASLYLLLCFPKALKSLKISEGVRYDDGFGPHQSRMHGNVRPNHFADAITKSSQDSLERLSLDLGYRRGIRNINADGQHLNLSLLERVTYLELSADTAENMVITRPVCDHQTYRRLPPNLQTFKVFKLKAYGYRRAQKEPDLPADDCLIKNKVSHGVPHLRHMIWSFHYCHIEGNRPFEGLIRRLGGHQPGHPQQIKFTKAYLASYCNKNLPMYRHNGVRMQIEFVQVPDDFIPPFLYPEPKPEAYLYWDSEAPPTEASKPRNQGSGRHGRANEPATAEASDSSFSPSDSDSDSDFDIPLAALPPQAQAIMAMWIQNASA